MTPGTLLILATTVGLVSLFPLAVVGQITFDCLTMLPNDTRLDQAQTQDSSCPISITIGDNFLENVQYAVGRKTRVQLKVSGSDANIAAIFCRVSPVLLKTPLGVWSSGTSYMTPFVCVQQNDALLYNSKPVSEGTVLSAYWTATGVYGAVELLCCVVDVNQNFWMYNSFMITPA